MNAIDSPVRVALVGYSSGAKMGNKVAENGYAAQLRSRHPVLLRYQGIP